MNFSTKVVFFWCFGALSITFNLFSNQNGYEEWKAQIEASYSLRWANNDLIQQMSDLLWLFNEDMRNLKNKPHDKKLQQTALYTYNFLRELSNKPKATSFNNIDHAWIETTRYETWKKQMQPHWGNIKQSNQVLLSLTTDLNDLKNTPHDKELQQKILYTYNFLRELLDKPKAASFDTIDYTWIENTDREVNIEIAKESYGWKNPNLAESTLIKQGQAITNIKNDIVALSCSVPGAAYSASRGDTAFVSLCDTPALDEALFLVYHELGHVKHGDIYPGKASQCPERMDNPEYQSDLTKLTHYLEVGKKAFDNSTNMGKRIHNILTKYPESLLFWTPPKKDYQVALCMRSNELLADLFAAQTLLSQGQLSPLLQMINDRSMENPNEWHVYLEHAYPHSFVRAITIAGLLVEHGIDINAEAKKWERTGQCIPFEKTTHPFTALNEKGAQKGTLPRCRAA